MFSCARMYGPEDACYSTEMTLIGFSIFYLVEKQQVVKYLTPTFDI